jgi:hypothetical protein
MSYSGPPPVLNIRLALARRAEALANQDSEQAMLRNSGFNLEMAVGPYWDRSVWESFKSQFGRYPFGPGEKPPGVSEAPSWVKEICGVKLNPAERMGGGSR